MCNQHGRPPFQGCGTLQFPFDLQEEAHIPIRRSQFSAPRSSPIQHKATPAPQHDLRCPLQVSYGEQRVRTCVLYNQSADCDVHVTLDTSKSQGLVPVVGSAECTRSVVSPGLAAVCVGRGKG